MQIPKIIHQIWSGVDEPLPKQLKILGETWKKHHPTWQYVLWNNAKMNNFVRKFYPQYWDIYSNFKYNIQRWDAIRYLILYKIGGMYVDFDSECLDSFDELLDGKKCCFSLEPKEHAVVLNEDIYFNNALIACVIGHPFMEKVIKRIFSNNLNVVYNHRNLEILNTTGPLMLVRLYEEFLNKDDIYLIPSEYVSPFTREDTIDFLNGHNLSNLEKKIENAISIHYFFNMWSSDNK